MKTTLIRIGNSRGIRIPKPIIEQCGLKEEVELEIQQHGLVIRPPHRPRAHWEQAFQKMAERGEDRLLDRDIKSERWIRPVW